MWRLGVCVVTDMSLGVEEEHSWPCCLGPLDFGGRLGLRLQEHPVKCDVYFFQINVRVTTMDAELEFAIQPNTTGKQLFDQVGLCALQRVPS